MTTIEQFFHDHTGFSYIPARETPEQGCERNAVELAAAYSELYAVSTDAYVSWEIDPDITSHDWEDPSEPERPTLIATLFYGENVVGSLGGIDVKDCNTGDPYCKVIEAELWREFAAQRESCIVRGDN